MKRILFLLPSIFVLSWITLAEASFFGPFFTIRYSLDVASCSRVAGWACYSNGQAPFQVHVYRDGPAGGGGVLIAGGNANVPREAAVGSQCGGNNNAGFDINLGNALSDGNSHTLYVYYVDPTNGGNGLINTASVGPCGSVVVNTPTPTSTPSPTPTSPVITKVTPTPTPTATKTATPNSISPVAECVDVNSSTSCVAHFGYSNNGQNVLSIPVGINNAFSPGEINRGQPTSFNAGFNSNAAVVAFDCTSLSWTLGINTATASSSSPKCTPEPPCESEDHTEEITALDTTSLQQKANVNALLKRLNNLSKGKEKQFVVTTKLQASNLQVEQWNLIWTQYPVITQSCPGSTTCATVSLASTLNTFSAGSMDFVSISNSVANRIKKYTKNVIRPSEQKLLRGAQRLDQQNQTLLKTLPTSTQSCG